MAEVDFITPHTRHSSFRAWRWRVLTGSLEEILQRSQDTTANLLIRRPGGDVFIGSGLRVSIVELLRPRWSAHNLLQLEIAQAVDLELPMFLQIPNRRLAHALTHLMDGLIRYPLTTNTFHDVLVQTSTSLGARLLWFLRPCWAPLGSFRLTFRRNTDGERVSHGRVRAASYDCVRVLVCARAHPEPSALTLRIDDRGCYSM